MPRVLAALATGTLFGAGLTVSDMVNPSRVQAFLDVAGAWDATLLLVMAAALVPSAAAYALHRRMARPMLGGTFVVPTGRSLDARLIGGAILFGAGWGLAGLCPGPAIAGLVFGVWPIWLFVAALLAGMLLHRVIPFASRSNP